MWNIARSLFLLLGTSSIPRAVNLSSRFEKMKNSCSACRIRLLLMNVRGKLEAAELAGYTVTFDERFVGSLPGSGSG
jgi:hypothetical protein